MNSVLRWLKKYRSVFALTLAGVFLLLAQSAYWVNHTIFDKTQFTSIVTSTLNTEESRQAIATTVVNKALAERPVVKRVAGAKATQLVTGLLGTDIVTQTFNTLINKAYEYLTSANPQDIDIDLLAIKTPLARIVSFAEDQGREVAFDPNNIPDTIVLFDASALPDIYRYSQMVLIFGPFCWLLTLGIFAAYIYRGRRVLAKRVYIVGGVILAVSFIGLLAGPLLPPPVMSFVPNPDMRSVVGSLITNLLAPFSQQMWTTILITVSVLAVFSLRFKMLNGAQKVLAIRPGQKEAAETAKTPSKKPAKKRKA